MIDRAKARFIPAHLKELMNLELYAADTTPEAARVHLEIIRRLSPETRLELAVEMSNNVREVAASGVRSRHPDYSPEQVRLAVVRLMLGDELFRKVHPGIEIAV